MNKSLGWIAGVSFGLALLFFVLAALFSPSPFSIAGNGRLIGNTPQLSQNGLRQWAWDGDNRLEIAFPAQVTLVPGGPPTVIVRGSENVLTHVGFRHGTLLGDDISGCFIPIFCHGDYRDHPVSMEVHGVSPEEIDVSGVAEVNLGHIEQDRLKLRVSGAGSVQGEGRVQDLDLSISGAGEAKFARLDTLHARVSLSGAGEAEIAPSEDADVSISGMGDVNLATKPKNLTTHISGMGEVNGPGIERHRNRHGEDDHASNDLGREISRQVRAEIQAQHIGEKVKEKVEKKLKAENLEASPPATPVPPAPP
jgi:hypothetical protein